MNRFLDLHPKSAREVSRLAETALRAAEAEVEKIAQVKGRRTVENTLEPLNRAAIAIAEARGRLSVYAAAHPGTKARAAAEKAIEDMAAFYPKLYLRRDIYEAIRAVSAAGLDAAARRFREKELLDFKLTGVDKPANVRAEIKRLVKRNVKLGQAFDRNIKDDVRHIDLKPEQLAGLPEDYRKAHAPGKNGLVRLSTQYPDYRPFMKYAKDGGARKKFSFRYLNRAWPKNEKTFKELLAGRLRHAELLGFKHYADYVTVDKMTGSAKAAQHFLDRIGRLTEKRAAKDYEVLLARKRQDDPETRAVGSWESAYYDNLAAKERTGFDSQKAREYFHFKKVKPGVLRIAERLFGLQFNKVAVRAWHPAVEVFAVRRNRKLIGRFYLDLHPRAGKYGHAACFDIRPGIKDRQFPEAALICNFTDGLMSHDEVTTFLHEFGHLMHFILAGEQHWARFSGFATEWDFVEAPSQMLEQWAFDYDTLRRFAMHQRTGKPIPRALVDALQKAEDFGKGIWNRQQLYYATLSLRYYENLHPRRANLSAIAAAARQKSFRWFTPVAGTHMYASFGHLNSYSAMYYTYLWSLAIAKDILTPFRAKGFYDRATAKRYAEKILMPGGSKCARELLRDFLGREWELKAFQEWLRK